MSFEPPAGILDIGNATLRVGKLEVSETSGLNQGLQNIVKNDLLVTEKNESSPYTTNQKWGLKLPTAWVGEFEIKGQTGKYIEFNFYNEGSTSNAQGYTLNFKDTSLTLKYDNGNNLPVTGDTVDSTLSLGDPGYGVATIPTIVGTFRKVNIFFERGVIAVSIDGIRYLYYKESDTFNQGLGVASRVVSTTGGAFVNVFIESDHSGNSQFKNLRIVNGRFISDKTSNVSFIGSLGVGVNSPQEALDIRGNMHFNRVSNVSQVKVDSNVVAEYTGPHDRPLRKYPEVALTSASDSGYVTSSSTTVGTYYTWKAFDNNLADDSSVWTTVDNIYDSNDNYAYNSDKSLGGVDGEWLKIELPNKIKPSYVRIYPRTYVPPIGNNQSPEDFKILASNDDTNWVELVSVVGWVTNATWGKWDISSNTPYKYFAIVCTRTIGAATFGLAELEYYGYEEGSGSLDTTLKTVYNVPATTGTQLEVYYDAKDLTTMPSTVTDLSPNSNGGSVTGATLDTTDGIESFKFATSSSQYIEKVFSGYTQSTEYSASVWFKSNSYTADSHIFQLGLGDHSNGSGIGMNIESEGPLRAYIYGYGSSSQVSTSVDTIATNNWYHATATYYSSGKNELYINGVLVGEGKATQLGTINASAPLTLGTYYQSSQRNTPSFNGSIANFRLFSKALNAGQVKELYDYQKDYFLGSKSQVTLYKGHLGVGVTEPSGQLELAGDERIQEYPPMAMTGWETYMEGHGVFRAGKSGHDDYFGTGWERWKVFNKGFTANGGPTGDAYHGEQSYSSSTGLYTGVGTQIESLGGISGDYFILDMPYKISLKHTNLTSANQNRSPTAFVILGSNDGSTWTQIKSFSSSFNNTAETLSFQVNSTEYFSYFGLVVTKVVASDGYLMLSEWQLFGTPGPTTLDKGSLTLGRSLDVPRVSRYDVDTETPRPEKLVIDFDTTVNDSPTDISGKGNHGVYHGSASYVPADKAFNIPNLTGIVVRGSSLGSGAQPLTLCAWAKGTGNWNADANDCIIGVGPNSSSGHSSFQLCVNTDAITLDMASASNFVEYPVTITNHRWYFFAMTYSGGDAFTNTRVYLDGVEITKPSSWTNGSSATLSLPSSPDIGVGTRTGNGTNNTPAGFLGGMVSNPKVYNVALEPSEIKKLYNLGRTGRSMVISDTAVGIGKVPEAQLDVRGSGEFTGDLSVKGNMNNHQYWFWGDRTSQSAGQVIGSSLQIEYSQTSGYTSAWKNSNTWECPVDGVWMVMGNFMAYPHSNQGYFWVEVRKYENDGSTLLSSLSALDMHTPYRDSVYQSWHFKQGHHCKRGQKLQVWYRCSGTNAYMELHSHWGNINIFKIG